MVRLRQHVAESHAMQLEGTRCNAPCPLADCIADESENFLLLCISRCDVLAHLQGRPQNWVRDLVQERLQRAFQTRRCHNFCTLLPTDWC